MKYCVEILQKKLIFNAGHKTRFKFCRKKQFLTQAIKRVLPFAEKREKICNASKLKNVLRKFAHEKMILNKKKKLAKIAIVRKKLMGIFTSFMKIENSQI